MLEYKGYRFLFVTVGFDVSRTQVRVKVIPSRSQGVAIKDVKEFLSYFSTVEL